MSLQQQVVWRTARTEAVAVAVVVCCVVVGSDIFCFFLLIGRIACSASALCNTFCCIPQITNSFVLEEGVAGICVQVLLYIRLCLDVCERVPARVLKNAASDGSFLTSNAANIATLDKLCSSGFVFHGAKVVLQRMRTKAGQSSLHVICYWI